MKVHPAVFMVALLVALAATWVGIMASALQPKESDEVRRARQIKDAKLARYIESAKTPEVRAMEAEDERMSHEAGDDRDFSFDNRGAHEER